jgi:signal transduction histidine kinase
MPDTYSIRPAGRHVFTIGRDLIQDQFAAIVELVKNAYDADSPDVIITFEVPDSRDHIVITIQDHGHGMSRDTIISKWLVPSTDDKLIRRVSPKGRQMQGRKGVGRYAASILGVDLLLETVTSEGEKTVVYVVWNDFEKAQYLADVEVLVQTTQVSEHPGTILTINGGPKHLAEWDKKQINKLQFELKKLIPPIDSEIFGTPREEEFSVFLNYTGYIMGIEEHLSEQIKPYPIFDLYDYRIRGTIAATGKGSFVFDNQRARNMIPEDGLLDLKRPTGCGELTFDIRVYDREVDAIDQLIRRGLKDKNDNYMGKREARDLLNEYNGIGVYRGGFRIRPLGDPGFDWLKLNSKRVQNPSMKIGINQVIGYVKIQDEELSGLEEKSARDGLRENQAYQNLENITADIIVQLESRRFEYRRKAGLSRPAVKIEQDLQRLFEFDELKQSVRKTLIQSGVDESATNEILGRIAKKEDESNQLVEGIRQAVAVYQGQATLGKIINVVLHEGRRPLNFFKNQVPNVVFWANEFKISPQPSTLDKIIPIAEGFGRNAEVLVELFARIDPLAARKRGKKREFKLGNVLADAFHVFEEQMIQNKISYDIICPADLSFLGWHVDILIILTNLIDNSIYWMVEKNSPKKHITVVAESEGPELEFIDYRDSGPGIEPHLIQSEVIFEPEFSTKPDGTGLGLAIAGEAAARNGLVLSAFETTSGAYFRIQTKEENSSS